MANKVIESPKYLSLVNKQISYGSKYDLAQTKILIYKNEFILNLRYKLKVYNKGFYLNGLNGLE